MFVSLWDISRHVTVCTCDVTAGARWWSNRKRRQRWQHGDEHAALGVTWRRCIGWWRTRRQTCDDVISGSASTPEGENMAAVRLLRQEVWPTFSTQTTYANPYRLAVVMTTTLTFTVHCCLVVYYRVNIFKRKLCTCYLRFVIQLKPSLNWYLFEHIN